MKVDHGGGEKWLMRLRAFLALIIAVIVIAARLISGFRSNQFRRLPGEPDPLLEPSQRMTKREAINITSAVLFPLVAVIILAIIFSR